VTAVFRSAASMGLLSCLTCGLVSRPAPAAEACACPRCGARLHLRKPASIARTWALLIAAMILYIPANILPIMETNSLFDSQSDTIMSGVEFLWTSGSWPLAIIVFFASIIVPLLKMVAIMVLLLSVQRHLTWRPEQRTRLYRLTHFIGRWSMLDIYVLAILVTLVQLQTLARITPGAGAMAFAAVVVLTILASMSFDPRLIWDSVESAKTDG
jgi:paraquat-inducible protein A